MKRFIVLIVFSIFINTDIWAQGFSLEQVTSYPFFSELSTLPGSSKIAVAINEKGKRNIYVKDVQSGIFRKLTNNNIDDGKEITNINISTDGKWVVYVSGADHGAFDETIPRNPSSATSFPKIQIFSIPFAGGKPIMLAEGDEPLIDPTCRQVIFVKDKQAWMVPINGSAPAKNLFYSKGKTNSIQYSPDGNSILFVSSRGDHSFISIYTNERTPIQYIAPAFARDQSPRWSPDGKKIVFIRMKGGGGAPDSLTVDKHRSWAIWVADVATGKATQLWKSPETLPGSVPSTNGSFNLHWAAGNRVVFLSYLNGWPHLYSINVFGGEPILLTPGLRNIEQIKLSPDKQWLVFTTNSGDDKNDIDRRHIGMVPVDKASVKMITSGVGIESTPAFLAGGAEIVFLSATAQRPTLPATVNVDKTNFKLIGQNLIPSDFPFSKLVVPSRVQFKAADGDTVYGQLFEPKSGISKKPAVLFVHGGPQRQMLLGWHYMDYYANTYALNQYLVSKGFIVLSVNYRLGVGYGFDFQNPKNAYLYGASEYLDIKAAGDWLAAQPQVDAGKIGIYGGSYGGFLTALALAKDSKLFVAGVDIHGEHNFMNFITEGKGEQAPDLELAKQLAWQSSPVAYLDRWTSPVLIIHGDDDGNVDFHQSVDLVTRFEEKKIPYESLVIPDETHHWMKYSNMVKVDSSIVNFLEIKLGLK